MRPPRIVLTLSVLALAALPQAAASQPVEPDIANALAYLAAEQQGDGSFISANPLTTPFHTTAKVAEVLENIPASAGTLAAGVAAPYGNAGLVPYSERFFLGGLNTLRGYRFRGIGPNENGFSVGGQTEIHGTLEYRYPLVKQIQPGTYREYESLQIGAFFDFGVLDPLDFEIDLDEVRMSAGFLFGVSIPIPLTFSFGWPLRDVDGDDRERVFGFDIGFR